MIGSVFVVLDFTGTLIKSIEVGQKTNIISRITFVQLNSLGDHVYFGGYFGVVESDNYFHRAGLYKLDLNLEYDDSLAGPNVLSSDVETAMGMVCFHGDNIFGLLFFNTDMPSGTSLIDFMKLDESMNLLNQGTV